IFRTEEVETWALNDVNIEVKEGEFIAVMGPSGCGKSTLLNIFGLLDNPTNGEYYLNGTEVSKYTESQRTGLRSYLGILEDIELKVSINGNLPDFTVDLEAALLMATTNSPDIQHMIRLKLESESAVERAKVETGLKTEMYLRFGLTQTAGTLKEAYRDSPNQQYISLSLAFPILDWGRGKGRIRLARSQRDLVYAQTEQSRTDFDLNVRKLVKQFNLQKQRVQIAARTNETAQRRHEVARRLYILGKSTILDLNASISEKDAAKRNYVNALHTYWGLYYALRSLTLYDFETSEELKIQDDKLKNGG
ncbi:hypothetical protein EZS27_029709, partial [termite gut metagenome]